MKPKALKYWFAGSTFVILIVIGVAYGAIAAYTAGLVIPLTLAYAACVEAQIEIEQGEVK